MKGILLALLIIIPIRADYLTDVINENFDSYPYLWTTIGILSTIWILGHDDPFVDSLLLIFCFKQFCNFALSEYSEL